MKGNTSSINSTVSTQTMKTNFTSLSDFQSTWYDSFNKTTTYYSKFEDRTVSVTLCEDFWVVCMNNRNYIVDEPIDSNIYGYVGWDATLLLDRCVDDLAEALEIASKFAAMKNIPVIHPEYADPMAS